MGTNKQVRTPETLIEAIRYFTDLDVATEFVAKLRWPDGPVCPACGGTEHSYLTTRRVWKCKSCRKQFSVKKGTIFEDSPLGLDRWLAAIWLVANCKNGISSYEVGRDLGITQKSAWFMLHRIRLAMQTGSFDKLSGHVEADETYIGGKARYMHADKRRALGKIKGPMGKTAVLGIMERGGQVRAQVLPNTRIDPIQSHIRNDVEAGSTLYTDSFKSYQGLYWDYEHKVVDHAERYVDGQVHTNGLENFWSLLKRGLRGTYVKAQPFHLFRYIDEQVYRFNARGQSDAGRFIGVLEMVSGRRVTWDQLTGKG